MMLTIFSSVNGSLLISLAIPILSYRVLSTELLIK